MADTITYFHNGVPIPFDSLSDSIRQLIELAKQRQENGEIEIIYDQPKDTGPGYTPFILVMSFIVIVAYIGVKRAWKEKGTVILHGGRTRGERVRDHRQQLQDELRREYNVYEGRDIKIPAEQLEKMLEKRSAYYRQLSPEFKERFLKRIKAFLHDKTFLIKSHEPFTDMPVLLSAAAVQLTFGLDKYELPHYQYIRIFPEEYFASDESLRVLAGHVYGNTITVSWNHFLKGFEESTDGINLGLHEMAHALYFQLAEADSGRCRNFIANFEIVMQEGNEMYQLKDARPSGLFRENAYRNLQEFWAETVELFFERPAELRRENSDLYEATKDILNQDPVNALYPLLAE